MIKIAMSVAAWVTIAVGIADPINAQGLPQQLPSMTQADQARATKDMLAQIRNAVAKRLDDRTTLYKLTSKRLFVCAFMYGIFAKRPELETSYRAWYSASQNIFLEAATVIYPDTPEAMKRDFGDIKKEIPSPTQDKEIFYLLRNCKDLSDPNATTVGSAIDELALSSSAR
jgi:hypothetical protein